ncbi:TonB-dependent receptor [Halioxenophilus sp. WMMB6]|uniref:TonB-dependent receptor n=1 Tax=Halioxenophilus sp. WMMB6 TaxID=3073815 RepID=UPI00295EF01E|nr:TonB-dependent receptor [Halioxenophilus sp. WMMB6]
MAETTQKKITMVVRPLVLAVAAAGFTTAGYAQSSDNERASVMEEVVVTARRRDESLSKVPIAVTAMNDEALDARQVLTDSDLQFAVPGLTIRQTQGNNSLTYSIRGQSADTFSGSPSAVVAYMNEVPLTVSGASTFYDLESVQVLKGPQGTLFGRNTTGGAVLYTSAKPTNELEGELTIRGGNFDMTEVQGVINTPIVDDTVLFRLAFNSLEKDGYIDNITTGATHGDVSRDSVRMSLTVRPSDSFENTSVYAYSRIEGTNTGATYVYSVYSFGDTNNGFNLNGFSSFLFPDLVAYADEQKSLGLYKTSHPFGAEHVGEDQVFTNTTTVDISENLQLKNILGYTKGDTDSEQPALGAPWVSFATRNVVTGKVGNEFELESFSNELQLSGEAAEGKLNYIVGFYYQDSDSETLWPQTYFLDTAFFQVATSHFGISTETAALYSQGTYSLTDSVKLTAGYRYTEEDVSIEQLPGADFYNFPGFSNNQDETFTGDSWELGIEYDVSDSLFAYAKARASFRSGGFNGSAPPFNANATGGGNKFDEETVQDFEIGVKYEGELLDLPTRMSLAVYQQTVDDVQRIEFPDPDPYPNGLDLASIAVTANVPEMEVKGFELEMSMLLSESLEMGLMAAITDAEFTDGDTTLFGVDYSYSPVANTPETTWSVWAKWSLPISSEMGELDLFAEYYSQDDMYFSNTADSIAPDTELPSYELVNARFNWSHIMGSDFSGALFGKNLTDEEYFVGGMALGASLGHNAAAVGEPRTYGVELSYQF